MIKIVSQTGLPANVAVKELLDKKLSALHSLSAGKTIRAALRTTTQNHFRAIYPGSRHYSPDKVTDGAAAATARSAIGSVAVNVPGVTRAYHDLTIVPRFRKYLTIPIHRSAYGKKAGDFRDLFVVTKKNGNKLLAQNDGSGIAFLFALKERVFQKKDSRLMPTDNTFAANIFSRLSAYLQRAS